MNPPTRQKCLPHARSSDTNRSGPLVTFQFSVVLARLLCQLSLALSATRMKSMSDEPRKPLDHARIASDQPPAEVSDRPSQSDVLPQESSATGQESSADAGNRAEKAKGADEGSNGDNADRLSGELERSHEPMFADRKPSDLEAVIDNLALLSHDEELGLGNDRDGFDQGLLSEAHPSFQPRTTLDLIRKGVGKGQIYVSQVEWTEFTPELCYAESIEHDGRWHFVPMLPPALYESLLLPTGLTDYGSTRDLFESICNLFQEHLALFRNQCEILAYWCFASWFPEVLRFVPRLTITGPRFAADLLFRVVRGVCRRPVLLAGMNSAVLKAIPLNELMPTLLIRETSLNKRKAELLDASDQKDYLVASGKDLRHYCCAKCIYLGEGHGQQATLPDGIHIHVGNARFPGYPLSWDRDIEVFQNKLFLYRSLHYLDVLWSRFRVDGLLPELCAVAQQLGAAIVGDDDLQKHVVDSLKEQSEQARVDRASGTKAMVLRAVLFHCHQSDQQQVFAREIAATVNRIYSEEGESLKVSSETVGHVLKSLGLYSRRLGNGGRGLMLDKSTQSKAHELSHAYEVLPEVPACGYCHKLQVPQSKETV